MDATIACHASHFGHCYLPGFSRPPASQPRDQKARAAALDNSTLHKILAKAAPHPFCRRHQSSIATTERHWLPRSGSIGGEEFRRVFE
jgi:hypothetical protein